MMDAMTTDDGELVRRVRDGDARAFRELVTRYQGHVYGLAVSLIGDWADAQDAAQETFIRAYANLDKLREPNRFAAWLRRVTFGVSMDWLRAYRPKDFARMEGRVSLDLLEIPDFRPGPPEESARRELAEAVLAAVADLPPKYRVPLTMFHLNGLSYRKVARFLDIPLGTAKSIIHRAREKLRAVLTRTLAEEVEPVVKEVFDEHKLPDGFADRVLAGVAEIGWHKGACCFAGSVVSCLGYRGDPVAYERVMGVSGGAFFLVWKEGWHPDNVALPIIGAEPIRRALDALGYEFELLGNWGLPGPERTEELYRAKIASSIDAGRPVIAFGVVGPPECCVVAGYEGGGEVLRGYSYFQESREEYFEREGWFPDCPALLLVGDRREPPPDDVVLRNALEWGLTLAKGPEIAGRHAGLAAYDAWARLLSDPDQFPPDLDEAGVQDRVMANGDGTCVVMDARKAGADFLRREADGAPRARDDLLAAADLYAEESLTMTEAVKALEVPFPVCPSIDPRRIVDPDFRRDMAEAVLACRGLQQRAIGHLEAALAGLT